MNLLIVGIECAIWCFLFTILNFIIVIIMKKTKNYQMVNLSYPPEIVERLVELGKIKTEERIPLGKRLIKKMPILVFYVVAFTCLLYFVNGSRDFLTGFLSSLIIMLVWTWYDALILDCLIFCNTKIFVIEGTEDMTKAYHDYWFHVKASIIGTILSILGSLAIGGIIALIASF